jgi:hypothetical protein
VTVQVPDSAWPDFVTEVGRRFQLLRPDALEFARRTRVVPISTPTGVRIDIVLAGLPYEESAIRRSVAVTVAGKAVRLCTAEDLIVHKLASERPRDLEDVEGIIARQGTSLDRGYLDPLVAQLAAGLERPEIERRYRSFLRS